MKKKFLAVLSVLVTFLYGLFALPVFPVEKMQPRVVLPIDIPPEIIDEELSRQLEVYAKIATVVKQKERNSLSRIFSKQERKELSQWLSQIAEMEKDECYKSYLEVLAGNITQKNRFTTDIPQWEALNDNRAEIIFAEDERFRVCRAVLENYFNNQEPLAFNWEKNGFFDTYIYINDPEANLKLQEYSDALAKMQDNLPPIIKQEMPYSPLRPVFKPVNLIFSTNPNVLTMLYPAITPAGNDTTYLPPDAGAGKPFKIVIFTNLAKAYFDGILKTVAGQALSAERVLDVDYESYLSNIVMHRISHHLGPVFVIRMEEEKVEYLEVGDRDLDSQKIHRRVPKKRRKTRKEKELKTIPEILTDLFPIVESIKADVTAIHNTEVLIETGLISEDKDINIYSTYVASLVDRLRNLPNEKLINSAGRMDLDRVIKEDKIEDFISALIQFNYLFQNEAIVFDINSKTFDIDRLKFKSATKALIGIIFRILANPTYVNVETYFENKLIISPQLDEVLTKVKPIPLKIRFQSQQEAWR